MSFLKSLNPEQRKAVEYTEGPLLVLAGAGSGKTRVITHRVAYLIYYQDILPENILTVTFTNKAAGEMKERVHSLLREDLNDRRANINDMWIGTFHAVCLRILRRHGHHLGYDNDFSIHDRAEQLSLIRECIKDLNINKTLYPPELLMSRISYLKSRLVTPHEFDHHRYSFGLDEKLSQVYELYQQKLKDNKGMDFDDLLINSIKLFSQERDILLFYREKFRHILVDEYQDTNIAQYRLIKFLASEHRNLCVVGDDDQSIYRFRGAEVGNIFAFERDFPDAKVFRLERNYRSTRSILRVANILIATNRRRKSKKLWTENHEGDPVIYKRVTDEREEARYVVDRIKELLSSGKSPGNLAILYRTNAQSRVLEEALGENNIPYMIIKGTRFYDRKEIKDILAYLRVILRPDDNVSLKRIINTPPRGIGHATINLIEDVSREKGLSLYEAMAFVSSGGVKKFLELIEKLQELHKTLPPSMFVERLIDITGYITWLSNHREGEDRINNIKEFIGAVRKFSQRNPEGTLMDFLDEISLLEAEPVEGAEPARERVSLMTLHSAKGLEFPVVFITGIEEGLLPHARSVNSVEDVEEERRLFYVGITRAKEKLYLTSTTIRSIYGNEKLRDESRFMEDLKRIVKIDMDYYRRDMYNMVTDKAEESRPQRSDRHRFRAGNVVSHPVWGTGRVINVEESGDREKVTVRFKSGNVKKLVVKFAKLELIG